MDKVTLKYFGLNDTLSSGPTVLSFKVPNGFEAYDSGDIQINGTYHRAIATTSDSSTTLHWFHDDLFEGVDYLVYISLTWWGPTTFGSPLYRAYKYDNLPEDPDWDEVYAALMERDTTYTKTYNASLNLVATDNFTNDSQFLMLVEALELPEPIKRFGYQVTLSYNNAHPLVFNCEASREGYDDFKAALDAENYAAILNNLLYNPLTAGLTRIDERGRNIFKACITGDRGVPRWYSSYGYVKFTYLNDEDPTWTLAPDGIAYEDNDAVAYEDILPGAAGVCAFIEEVELSSTTTIISGGTGVPNINDDKYVEVQRRYLDG